MRRDSTIAAVRRLIYVALCASLAASAQGQEGRKHFCDAPGQRTAAETVICADGAVRVLDAKLDELYRSAVSFAKDPEALRTEQRTWLRDSRNRCADGDCMTRVYRARILALHQRILAATTPTGGAVNAQNVAAVCNEVAVLAGRKQLDRFAVPSIPLEFLPSLREALARSGASPEADAEVVLLPRAAVTPLAFTLANTGGTCPSTHLQNAQLTGRPTMLKVEDPEEELRSSWWGGGDYAAYVSGRQLVVTADLIDRNLVRLVSWVTREGRIQPLCSVKSETTKALRSGAAAAVCTQVVSGSAQAPAWRAAEMRLARDQWDERVGGYADEVSIARLDLDGDGRQEDIGWFRYDSGAGCGSHSEWLRVVNAERNGTVKGRLDDFLAENAGNEQVRVWRIGGQHYLETYHSRGGGTVWLVEASGTKRFCELGWDNKASVTKVWLR